ncbi:MAG: GRP family sugar transporter, partial [Candidatus Daviesbacteria bacterium]|nr:GRP family sugar transporter [Candidatus Daviesbacteria bacterium]
LMAVGIGISGLILSLLLGYPLSLNPYGLFSGVLWAAANIIALLAIATLGLSRAVPIIASLIIILSFLWGALVFNELPSGLLVGFSGIGLIILGVVLISIIGKTGSKNIKKGLLATVSAGVIWGSQWVPLKMGNVSTADFFFPVCLGIFVSGLIIFVLKREKFKKEAVKESLLSGLIWNIGNLLSLIALSLIGLSKMGPISQSATLVAVLWGVFYFKEVTGLRSKLQVLIGAVVLLVGVGVLSFA